MSEFLRAVSQANVERIIQIYEANTEVSYDRDSDGNNALAIAVLMGHWNIVITLLKYCRVSPHALNNNGDSLYHLIPKGLKVRRPQITDYEEIRAENLALWRNEEQKERNRINEIKAKNPDMKPPEDLLIKKAVDCDKEYFGNLELFFPKYIMNKYHVVLVRKNSQNVLPYAVAMENREPELAEFYEENSKSHMIRRRLVAGLNENLVRDIATFL